MGLFACVAFSPTAFAAPDTGPKADHNEFIKSITADQQAAEDITDMVVDQGNDIDINIMYSAPGQANGQETGVHRSDHTDGNRYILNPALDLMTVSNALPLAATEPERSCYNMIMKDRYSLDNKKTAAGLPLVGVAKHAPQMVPLLRRHPAWTMPRYLRC